LALSPQTLCRGGGALSSSIHAGAMPLSARNGRMPRAFN
jgi:hypothetical protein